MDKEQALADIKEKKSKEMESFYSCVRMFLENRKNCGVESDASFIKWITNDIKERDKKLEKLWNGYCKQFPD
jgi:hypothetical protein